MPIDYDAKGIARHKQGPPQEPNPFGEEDNPNPENPPLPIQPGPWKYTGGD